LRLIKRCCKCHLLLAGETSRVHAKADGAKRVQGEAVHEVVKVDRCLAADGPLQEPSEQHHLLGKHHLDVLLEAAAQQPDKKMNVMSSICLLVSDDRLAMKTLATSVCPCSAASDRYNQCAQLQQLWSLHRQQMGGQVVAQMQLHLSQHKHLSVAHGGNRLPLSDWLIDWPWSQQGGKLMDHIL